MTFLKVETLFKKSNQLTFFVISNLSGVSVQDDKENERVSLYFISKLQK